MRFIDLVKEPGYSISFEAISEPRINGVRLRIVVNKSENETCLLIDPPLKSKVSTLQIDFPNYITYSVTYDDYTFSNKEDLFQGDSFRIYEKSAYLDYIQKEFQLKDKKLTHYSLACFEHKVDIISEYEPIISKVI